MVTYQRDYSHPYDPYDIQTDFMNAVYNCLDEGKIGILESPTGTGKTLSLICASVTWLREFKRKQFEAEIEQGLAYEQEQDEPDWLVANAKKQRQDAALRSREEREAKLQRIRLSEERARARYEFGEPLPKRQKTTNVEDISIDDEQSEFLLDDYQSGDERTVPSSSGPALSAETQALLQRIGHTTAKPEKEDDEDLPDDTKIFFCSRTHSQLSQFASELRRVSMAPAVLVTPGSTEEVKHLTLGSRKQLCINPKVQKLKHIGAINERCLELQQSSTPAKSKCSFLPSKENKVLVNDFRDHTLAKIKDIEDLGELGKRIGICPYYASRNAIKPTEVVTLPYPLLLQKSAREALDISLKGHVVIIDEAHNLLDSISNIHSASIFSSQLNLAMVQLSAYLERFSKRLNSKNRVYIGELIRVIDSLIACLKPRLAQPNLNEIPVEIADLLKGKGVDQINLYKLMLYLQESKLARKVDRYVAYREQDSTASQMHGTKQRPKNTEAVASTPVLTSVHSFLLTLTHPTSEGQFFMSKIPQAATKEEDVVLRYVLLDPTHHFKEIVQDARAVILAGGTMSPMSDYTDHLLHYLPVERIKTLSCGHIIPKSNLLVLPMSKGRGSAEFDFTFDKRNSENTINELGVSILHCARKIPDGMVVFFPSYAYLDKVIYSWQSDSTNPSIWKQLGQTKKIFLEPKASTSTQQDQRSLDGDASSPNKPSIPPTVEKLLQDYASHIKANKPKGALLFAVIGGSLSEGINFSDSLGRGIAVVGLPYPNAKSAEWKAKLEFVKHRHSREHRSAIGDGKEGAAVQAKDTDGAGAAAAKEYYENACMRAVNQSVGRAIRHKDDYATILLFDKRYERERIQSKLPGWIRRSLSTQSVRLMDAERDIERFFRDKQDVV